MLISFLLNIETERSLLEFLISCSFISFSAYASRRVNFKTGKEFISIIYTIEMILLPGAILICVALCLCCCDNYPQLTKGNICVFKIRESISCLYFVCLNGTKCCGYSLEAPQDTFIWRNEKININIFFWLKINALHWDLYFPRIIWFDCIG